MPPALAISPALIRSAYCASPESSASWVLTSDCMRSVIDGEGFEY